MTRHPALWDERLYQLEDVMGRVQALIAGYPEHLHEQLLVAHKALSTLRIYVLEEAAQADG